MYRATTREIIVAVEPVYLPAESSQRTTTTCGPTRFTSRTGHEVVQLSARHWSITDALGYVTR